MHPFHTVDSWDWSGAGKSHIRRKGIARATWRSGLRHVSLAHGFSRDDVVAQLRTHMEESDQGRAALLAFDFPFSFPFAPKGNQFPCGASGWFEFSKAVHTSLGLWGVAKDYYGEPKHYGLGGPPDHFAHFYLGRHQGPRYVEAYRKTEQQARAIGCPPASVFRLVNPMVGVQALAGIWVLRSAIDIAIRKRWPLTIWPLGRVDRSGAWHVGTEGWDWSDAGAVIVESYPRVSFARAGVMDRAGFGSAASIQAALADLGLVPGTIANQVTPTTADERDALIALLHLLSPAWFGRQFHPAKADVRVHLDGVTGAVPVPPCVAAPGVTGPLAAVEGNIFGV